MSWSVWPGRDSVGGDSASLLEIDFKDIQPRPPSNSPPPHIRPLARGRSSTGSDSVRWDEREKIVQEWEKRLEETARNLARKQRESEDALREASDRENIALTHARRVEERERECDRLLARVEEREKVCEDLERNLRAELSRLSLQKDSLAQERKRDAEERRRIEADANEVGRLLGCITSGSAVT
jgi:hypothetical protein